MPEGPYFHTRVLQSEEFTGLSVPERSISSSPQPSGTALTSTMRKDTMTTALTSEPDCDPARSRRSSGRSRCQRTNSSLSAGGKKVSFSEDHAYALAARSSAAVVAAAALLNNRRVVDREPSAETDLTGDAASIAAEIDVPTAVKNTAVRRAQSQREARATVTANGGATTTTAPAQFKYKSKRSASFRESLLRQGESFQVLMLGAIGVGKSSLVRQFQSGNHGLVSVKVSNVYGDNCRRANDAQLTIVDNPAMEISAEMVMSCCDADAYVIVYSVTDRDSFQVAQSILLALAAQENRNQKAAILVGNKVDLVRRRDVNTEEGKSVATSYGSKFIETSDWIDYNVDELFAGVLAQIRLRQDAHPPPAPPATSNGQVASGKGRGSSKRERRGYRRSKTLGAKSWGVLKDLINKINRKVKSCDDLHVL